MKIIYRSEVKRMGKEMCGWCRKNPTNWLHAPLDELGLGNYRCGGECLARTMKARPDYVLYRVIEDDVVSR